MNRIRVADSDTGGMNGDTTIPQGWTVADYFNARKGGKQPGGNYHVTVNQREAGPHTELTQGCTLVISAKKLAGAI